MATIIRPVGGAGVSTSRGALCHRALLLILMGGFLLCYLSIVFVGHRHTVQFDALASTARVALLRGMPTAAEWSKGTGAIVGRAATGDVAVATGGATGAVAGAKGATGAVATAGGASPSAAGPKSGPAGGGRRDLKDDLTPEERERRRRIMFSDLTDLPERVRGPELTTSYQKAHVVQRADWFKGGIECKDTCCVRSVAVSMDQDAQHIVTTIDGVDLADLFVHAHSKQKHFEWVGTDLTPKIVPCLKPGTIIYADHEGGGVHKFFDMFRPNITVPYLFITSETDGPEPMGPWGRDALEKDGKLIKWYGINPSYGLGANHPKFQMMHLGLSRQHSQQPYLLRLQRARAFQNPFAGEAKKRWTESKALAEATDTTPVLFVKFGIKRHSQHRKVPYEMACNNRTMTPLDDVSCNLEKTTTPQETYSAASKYLFGLSPPGLGNDCYRTYELMMLGVIPVVKKKKEYDELFDGLPVLQLDGWDHSQADLLKAMRDYIASPKFRDNDFKGWERLYMRYWRQKVLKDTGREKEVVRDPEGREYYQAWVYSEYTKPKISSWYPPKD